MKWTLPAIVLMALIAFGFVVIPHKKNIPKKGSSIAGLYEPVAVLELFTSEGCSSCPPADNLLPQLANKDHNIIPLSFHVDYWNKLGWKDAFSNATYSDRQRKYARHFALESVYTPQLIVNGVNQFVGSSRTNAEVAINNALKEQSAVKIIIQNVKREADKISFHATVQGDILKTDLIAAIVQRQAVVAVKAGENSGKKLMHTNVVRFFTTVKAGIENDFDLKIPIELTDANWQLIVYTQQQADFKITGATVFTKL